MVNQSESALASPDQLWVNRSIRIAPACPLIPYRMRIVNSEIANLNEEFAGVLWESPRLRARPLDPPACPSGPEAREPPNRFNPGEIAGGLVRLVGGRRNDWRDQRSGSATRD